MGAVSIIMGSSFLVLALAIFSMMMLKDKSEFLKEFLMGMSVASVFIIVLCIIGFIGTGITTVLNGLFG